MLLKDSYLDQHCIRFTMTLAFNDGKNCRRYQNHAIKSIEQVKLSKLAKSY